MSQVPLGPAPRAQRTLRRSGTDRVIGGVCGGLGRYLGVDPLLLRIAAIALALSGGVGVLAYIIAWIVIPAAADEPGSAPPAAPPATVAVVVGGALVALGALFLVREIFPWFDGGVIWALIMIGIGGLVVSSAIGRRGGQP